jgi:leucyl-tRNA synthetase
VWISDYILISYGTGAIMAVPAHDQRDFEFAVEFDLPILQVVSRDGSEYELTEADVSDGFAINSGRFDGLTTAQFKEQIVRWLEERNLGSKAINYKLRDWVFSRQRYWGEPIPLIHCERCGIVPVPYGELPLVLPEVQSYKPTGTGESPLVAIQEWVNTSCPRCGAPGKRETNTMPQWAGSCWYYLRYLDPHNDEVFAGRDKLEYWAPVDLYVGGAEHAVLHLLYARFWHKVLYDIGEVNTDEPFMRLVNQGMILGEGGVKMSKSLGNVINPDDVIRSYGADAMRMYEMFMGPLEVSKPWSTKGIAGIKRFLDRIWRLSEQKPIDERPPDSLLKVLHQTIRKVSRDTGTLQFNTAIAQMMIFVTEAGRQGRLYREVWRPFVLLLAPYAPHLAEELWEKLGEQPSVAFQAYPSWDEELAREDRVTVVFQINGKIRGREELPVGLSAAQLERKALQHPRIKELLAGRSPKKVITVADKLVNMVLPSA